MNFIPAAASLIALSAGVLDQAGTTLRVMVSHGGAPVEVRMVAVDENYKELPETRSFPDVLLATSDPRRVTMRVPKTTWAICAQTTQSYLPEGEIGAGFIVESCARVNPHKLEEGRILNFGAGGTRNTPGGHRLRQGLQNPEIQVIQEGREGMVSS